MLRAMRSEAEVSTLPPRLRYASAMPDQVSHATYVDGKSAVEA
jgi:hypothetical protein